jgi:PAS domain S-box-containing protein
MLLSAVLVWQIEAAMRTVQHIQLADRNISLTMSLNSRITDEETGVRGFQITSNEIFLQPYEFAQGDLDREFQMLRDNMVAMHADPAEVDRVVREHRDWQTAIAIPIVTATRAGQDTRDAGLNLRGKGRMDNIRVSLRAIAAEQRERRDRTVQHFRLVVRHTIEVTLGLALIIGLMLGVFARSRLHAISMVFRKTLSALRTNAEETERSEERLRTILRSIGDAVIVTDVQGRIEMMNAVAEQLTGYTAAEAIHQPAANIGHSLDAVTREKLEPVFSRILTAGDRVTLPHNSVIVRKDNSEIYVDLSGAPILDASGALTGAVMVFRDISEARQTQAALLANEKLAVAGRLAATIAHEIHNPLDAVINIVYLLRNNPSEQETASLLEMAAGELDRVTHISRALLGMYRESKTPIPVDVSEMMASLLLLLERHLTKAQISIATHLESGLITKGHPAELRQVFTNLLTNAIDASSPGDVLRVSVHPGNSTGILVTIADTGSGIDSDALTHLFQPFFTTKGENGTGLGLWVSQGILAKHGGKIDIVTETEGPEHGTTMTVTLPRA